jgi:hypothetical protein
MSLQNLAKLDQIVAIKAYAEEGVTLDRLIPLSGSGPDSKVKNYTKVKTKIKVTTPGSEYNLKYLKFKIIACLGQAEVNYYKANIYKNDDRVDPRIKTLTLSDIKNQNGEVNFYFGTEKYVDITDSLYFLVYTHYDTNALGREYGFSQEDTIGLIETFYSTIEETRAIGFNNIIDLTQFTDIGVDFPRKKYRPAKKYGSFFSQMFDSQDVYRNGSIDKNILRFGFFFDKQRFVLENTIMPEFFEAVETKNILLSASTLKSIKLYRYRSEDVEQNGDHKKELIADILAAPQEENVSFIKELKHNFDGLSFYTGIDFDVFDKTIGKYSYELEIQHIDGAYSVLATIIGAYISNIKMLEEYKSKAKNYYVSGEDRFFESLQEVAIQNIGLSSLVKKWINDYSIGLRHFYNIKESEINVLKATIENMISPKTGNLLNLQKFIDLNFSLLNDFKNILKRKINGGSVDQLISDLQSGNATGIPGSIQLMKINKKWDAKVDADLTKRFGMRYHASRGQVGDGIIIANRTVEFSSLNMYTQNGFDHIGPKFIYVPATSSSKVFPLIMQTDSYKSYYNNFYTLLDSYKTRDFNKNLEAYSGISSFTDQSRNALEVSLLPGFFESIFEKINIDFVKLDIPKYLLQINPSIVSLNREKLNTISSRLSFWAERVAVPSGNIPKIKYEMSPDVFAERNIGSLPASYTNDISSYYKFKFMYDAVKKAYGVRFNRIPENIYLKTKQKFITLENTKILNDLILENLESKLVNQIQINNENFVSESPINQYNPNKESSNDLILCKLVNYTATDAGLEKPLFDAIPTFNKWFFIQDTVAEEFYTYTITGINTGDIFNKTPEIPEVVIPGSPAVTIQPVTPIVLKPNIGDLGTVNTNVGTLSPITTEISFNNPPIQLTSDLSLGPSISNLSNTLVSPSIGNTTNSITSTVSLRSPLTSSVTTRIGRLI